MTSTTAAQTPATVTLARDVDSTLAIIVNARIVARIADGPNVVRRVERHLKAANVLRTTGYTVNDAGALEAAAVILTGGTR